MSKDSYRSPSDGPLLERGSWGDLLEANGFSGVEGHVDDYAGQPEHLFSAMWSTKREIRRTADQEEANPSVTVYHHFHEDEDVEYADTVSDHLTQRLGSPARIQHLLRADSSEDNQTCVILDSRSRSMLSDMSSEMFYRLKGLLMQASNLLWVMPDKSHPDASIIRMVQGQEIVPIRPVTSVPISQIRTGLRRLQSGQNIGKIVVTLAPGETAVVERPSPLKARLGSLLHSNATYLITGGTGGLGRALASWMIKKGARNLVLLGRSSTPSAKVIELLKRYEGTDVCVRALSCDVGSRTDLIRTIEALNDLPQVRGIIHGALYLQVSQRTLVQRLGD